MRTCDEEEEAFESCFDPRTGMIRDGVSKVRVPLKMWDSASDLPKRPDFYVRVDPSVALARQPGFVARDGRKPKKLQERDPEGREAGTGEFEDRQPGFVARDGVVRAVLDDCYLDYDERVAAQWRAKPPKSPRYIENNLDWLSADESDPDRNASYDQYDAGLRDQWRRAK
jgi:hypothetical protein